MFQPINSTTKLVVGLKANPDLSLDLGKQIWLDALGDNAFHDGMAVNSPGFYTGHIKAQKFPDRMCHAYSSDNLLHEVHCDKGFSALDIVCEIGEKIVGHSTRKNPVTR